MLNTVLKLTVSKYITNEDELVFAFRRSSEIKNIAIYTNYIEKDKQFLLILKAEVPFSKSIRAIYDFFQGNKIVIGAKHTTLSSDEVEYTDLVNLIDLKTRELYKEAFKKRDKFFFHSESNSITVAINLLYPMLISLYTKWKPVYWSAINKYEECGSLGEVVKSYPNEFPYRSKLQRYLNVSLYYEIKKIEQCVDLIFEKLSN